MNVLITGSSAGLGKSLALKFALDGHHIIVHGRDEKRLRWIYEATLASEIVIGDLSDIQTIGALYAAALKNEIDILINNAGQYFWGEPKETTPAVLDSIIQTNLLAPIKLALAIYPIFKAKGKGLIVNINSLAGKEFNAKEAAYCASKWGMRGFMGSFKRAARKDGIGVLDIYLGAMKTGMKYPRENENTMLDPNEVAKTIVTLCQVPSNYLRLNEVEIVRACA